MLNTDDLGRVDSLYASALQAYQNGDMEHLLEIVRCDNKFRHQAGRNGLLAIFSLLGEDDGVSRDTVPC